MKKVLLLIVTIFCVLLMDKVYAAESDITSVEANINGTKLTVEGTTESDVLAVSVLVYDESGNEFIKMKSGEVIDGKYTVVIDELDDTNSYLVRVANYNGGDFLEVKAVNIEAPVVKENTPETSDNFSTYIIIGVLSVLSLVSIIYFRKKLIR